MKMIVDSLRHVVIKDQIQIKDLTRREFQILWHLCQEPGRVYTREQIFNQVWGAQPNSNDRTVDVH
ncbi:MAG: helix-turn-helix domain-containing protein, partial [Saprospiraceae bacterium]